MFPVRPASSRHYASTVGQRVHRHRCGYLNHASFGVELHPSPGIYQGFPGYLDGLASYSGAVNTFRAVPGTYTPGG